MSSSDLITRIMDGRTDLVFEYVAAGNHAAGDTGETPLHSAICKADHLQTNLIVRLLLARLAFRR
jgi:hypothetical protein